MSNLVKLPSYWTPSKVLKKALEDCNDEWETAIVLIGRKDGTYHHLFSHMVYIEACGHKCAFDGYINDLNHELDDDYDSAS